MYHAKGDFSLSSEMIYRGFADIAANDYITRYQGLVGRFLIGETNLHGPDTDQNNFLKGMGQEVNFLSSLGHHIEEMCWFGFFGGRYWSSSWLRRPNRKFDDFGVVWLEPRTWKRRCTLFYDEFSAVASGRKSFDDMTAFEPQPSLNRKLRGLWKFFADKYGWKYQPVPPSVPRLLAETYSPVWASYSRSWPFFL